MIILGIDLGTTNSTCGIWRNGQVELIPNRLGEYLTPSVVGFDVSGELLVGLTAKERLINHSDSTVAVFKRLMGTNHQIKVDKKSFTATELSAMVLKSLKEDAEAYVGESIQTAVISVPAYFNDNQRHATKLAGEMAGLKVDRLINEPTAAAMAYGLHEKAEGTFLILDMGGGTFDVSILEFFDGVMEVHASAGDNYLGGEDFVEAMCQSVMNEFSVDEKMLSKEEIQQLYMQMETVKRRIDSTESKSIPIKLAGKIYQWHATEQWFAQVSIPLLNRVRRPIEQALRDAQMTPKDIDEVVLVGGSTRLKLFRNLIGRLFGRLPSCHLDPDKVVAMGAAIQAGLLDKCEALNDVVLTDVCPYTLGTEVNGPDGNEGGHFLPIIERNSVVPISIVRTVQTAHDNQTDVSINIYQGENRLVSKNIFLGNLALQVPRGKAGDELIDIRYSYDINGLLEVDAKICSTGKIFSKVIEQTPGALSKEEFAKSHQKLAALKFHPRDNEANQALMAKGERLYQSALGERREYIATILAKFDSIMERQNPLEIKKAQEELGRILKELDSEEWF